MNNLRIARLKHGYTQKDLSLLVDCGRKSVSDWECGLYYPTVEMMIKLSKVLNTSIDYLLGLEN